MAEQVGYNLRDIRNAINQTSQQLENIVVESGNSDAEIVAARTTYTGETFQTVGERVDFDNIRLADKVNSKIEKGAVQLDDLTTEVKQAMTGGSVPVVGENAVGQENLKNNSVTPEKTVMFVTKNLFNKDTITSDKFVDNATGKLENNTLYVASDYIPVSSQTTYTRNQNHRMAFYDSQKNYISGILGNSSNVKEQHTFTTPTNTRFIRTTIAKTLVNEFQLELGSQSTSYTPYGYKLNNDFLGALPIENGSIGEAQVAEEILVLKKSKNLFNKDSSTDNNFISWLDGKLQANVNYAASDYISVTPGLVYTRTHDKHIVFFNSNKEFISGLESVGSKSVTIPANAYYVRVSVDKRLNTVDQYQFEEGAIETSYEGYGLILPTNNKGIPVSYSNLVDNSNTWNRIDADSLGDSLTAAGVYQSLVKNEMGLKSYANHGIGGSRVSGVAADAFHQDSRISALNINAHLLTIMGGTNDWAQSAEIGEIDTFNINTFIGAYETVLQKVLSLNPEMRIFIMTPPFSLLPNRTDPSTGQTWDDTTGEKNLLGLSVKDYGEAAKKVAEYYGIPVIDLGGMVGWSNLNIDTFMKLEGVNLIHPNNEKGHPRMAEIISGDLRQYPPLL